MKIICNILLYFWQLPQNLIGEAMLLYFRKEKRVAEFNGRRFYIAPTMNGGISLGKYIILSPKVGKNRYVYNHEYGHSRQSLYLGWLYLLIIGIPSLIHASVCRSDNYYHFWTERWANSLGGIPGYDGKWHYHKDGMCRF